MEGGKGYDPGKIYIGTGKGSSYGDPQPKSVRLPISLLEAIRQFVRSSEKKQIKVVSYFLRNAVHHYLNWLRVNDLTVGNIAHQFGQIVEAMRGERRRLADHQEIEALARQAARHFGEGRVQMARTLVAAVWEEMEAMEGFWGDAARAVVREHLGKRGL